MPSICIGADCEAKPLAQRKHLSYAREGAKAAFCQACAAHDPMMAFMADAPSYPSMRHNQCDENKHERELPECRQQLLTLAREAAWLKRLGLVEARLRYHLCMVPDAHLVEEFLFYRDDSRVREAGLADLDSIVRMQEWDSAKEELLLGMLGRLLFPVGRFDNWQACLMLIGVGGSGKTTVTDAVINAGYSPEQMGYISNTIEKNFPFESLVNSSVVIAADVDKERMSNLPQTDLHKIINGERVEINIKYGGRRTVQWVAPFMLVANVVPNWQDDQAYRRLAVRNTQDGIMPNILTKYYPRRAEVGSKVQQDNDPLVHFVAETNRVRDAEDTGMTIGDWMFPGLMLKAHLEIDHVEGSATVLDKNAMLVLIEKIGQKYNYEAFRRDQYTP
ncbi:hypothetical protein T492DRAFT_867971 [Pavlovales sp. CCMP2436]|nr:hypothetical protein T492DRAFT_867971 [Pavlovales sp. CCMP2436]